MIYLVEASSYIKIGYTRDAETLPGRLWSLQTGDPHDQRLLSTIVDGRQALESRIHWALRHEWVKGEWFRAEVPMKHLIELENTFQVKKWLSEYRPSDDHLLPRRKVIFKQAHSFPCPACGLTRYADETLYQIAASIVHKVCMEEQPDEYKRPICEWCGGTIFKKEQAGKLVLHKPCRKKAIEARKKSKSKRKRYTERQEQEYRELRTRRKRYREMNYRTTS